APWSGDLLVEVRAIAARHVEALELAVAHHLELDALAGAAAPEGAVELLERRHLQVVERHEDVAFLDAALGAGTARHQPRDHQALLQRMRVDAEPGAGWPAHHTPVAEVLLAAAQVAFTRDGEVRAHDLPEVGGGTAYTAPRR